MSQNPIGLEGVAFGHEPPGGGKRMWLYWRLFLVGLGILGRRRRDLVLENLILRQQLAVWERSARRPTLHRRDRQFWSVTGRGWNSWRAHLHLVQPATVVGWHRLVWRHYWR